jgi:hypothetical protein
MGMMSERTGRLFIYFYGRGFGRLSGQNGDEGLDNGHGGGGVTFDKFFVWNFIVPLSENEKAGVIHKNGIKICVFRLLLFWQKISEHFGLQTTASRHEVLTKT